MSTTDAQLLQLFEEIDADESGLLDREEVAELAESLGAPLSTAELDDAMLQMDEDGSGEVDFDEFASWFRKLENSGAEVLHENIGAADEIFEGRAPTVGGGFPTLVFPAANRRCLRRGVWSGWLRPVRRACDDGRVRARCDRRGGRCRIETSSGAPRIRIVSRRRSGVGRGRPALVAVT